MIFLRSKNLSSKFSLCVLSAVGLLALGSSAQATTFTFNSDPFAGSTAITTPGRQIVQGEPSISFNPASDVFAFNSSVFGINQINFASGTLNALPTSGENVIALQTLDDDNNPATPFGAGNAATLIASHVTSSGPGLFIYFNSALQLDRLVFSTNLSDPTADLAVLARMTNLSGQVGINALPTFSASNFASVATPEPSSFFLLGVSGAFLLCGSLVRRRKQVTSKSK